MNWDKFDSVVGKYIRIVLLAALIIFGFATVSIGYASFFFSWVGYTAAIKQGVIHSPILLACGWAIQNGLMIVYLTKFMKWFIASNVDHSFQCGSS